MMDSLKLKEALARERELQQQLKEAHHRAEKEKEEAAKRIKAAEEKNGDEPQGKIKLRRNFHYSSNLVNNSEFDPVNTP